MTTDPWQGTLMTRFGHLAVVDPAMTYTWAEVDISMMYCEDPPPALFFDAYHDIHPAEPGWQERMELLHLRELLSTLAHFGEFPAVCAGAHNLSDLRLTGTAVSTLPPRTGWRITLSHREYRRRARRTDTNGFWVSHTPLELGDSTRRTRR
jgi:hypothetical protein